jgi:glutaredoxin-like protein
LPYHPMFSKGQAAEITEYLGRHVQAPVSLYTYARQKCFRDRFVKNVCNSEWTARFAAHFAACSSSIRLHQQEVKSLDELDSALYIRWLPAIRLLGEVDHHIRYYGIPSGYELNSFLRAIAMTSGAETSLSSSVVHELQAIDELITLDVFVTPTCFYCPVAAHLANQFAIVNPYYIRTNIVNATQFPELVAQYGIRGVPRVIINQTLHHTGVPDERLLLGLIRQSLRQRRQVY